MKLIRFLVIILVVFLVAYFVWDRYSKNRTKLCFSGKVVDNGGKAISSASVEVAGVETQTTEKGEFRLCVKPSKRFVLNVTKLGFGLASKVYTDTVSNITITMTTATVVEELDPAQEIIITDTTPAPSAPTSPDVAHLASPLDTIPFVYDASGRLIAFGAPPEIMETYEAVDEFVPQQVGATVVVEPDALEDPNETGAEGSLFQQSKEKGNVTGSLSTVDIYSPDGMPGDYTTRMGEGSRGFMVTYGAADVNFYRNGKPLQLKKGKFATLTIPVDTLALIYGQKLAETIPLLVYDKETGLWAKDGNNVGVLNKERTAYVAKISHFSVFNMDEEFAVGVAACIKLCSDAAPVNARIEITGDNPGHIKDLLFGASICASSGVTVGCLAGESAYLINNLKPNTPIGVRLLDGSANILSSYVFISGAAGTPNEFNCSNNYNGCNNMQRISWGIPCYQNTDAVGSIDGPIVATQPSGGTNFKIAWVYVDTGATGTPLANPSTNYKVEFFTVTNQNIALDLTDASWTDVATLGSNTALKNSQVVNIPTAGGTDPVLVRVTALPTGAPLFISGSVRLLNPATISPTSQFETDYNAIVAACDNVGQPIN